MRVDGALGILRVGYQRAADVGAWSIESAGRPREFLLRAKIADINEFWIARTPLDVALRVAGTDWIWRDISIAQEGDGFTTMLDGTPIVERA